MELKQKYIREAGYDVDEAFVESLQGMDIRTGIKIANFIEKHVGLVPENDLVSTVMGGVIIDDNNEPITFALEMIRTESPYVILSDVQLIDMDEYLDLRNLNLNIKSNESFKSTSDKESGNIPDRT
tara:strand:+ start:108 stop:485 length:378 start_codon:yes stop_codon:yes gene_type:complete